MDGEYYLTDEAGVETITEYGQTELLSYKKARFDCEDFATVFKGTAARHFGVNGVGLVIDWSADPAHAYNLIVYTTEDGLDVQLYEP